MSAGLPLTVHRLQELVDEVKKTKKARTLHLADGVVAVIKPAREPVKPRESKPSPAALSPLTVEEVFGSVPTLAHLKGADIDEMIHEAKGERATRLLQDS
jgi:hypothetical protein